MIKVPLGFSNKEYFWQLFLEVNRFYFGSKGNFLLKKRTKCLECCMHMLI